MSAIAAGLLLWFISGLAYVAIEYAIFRIKHR